MPFEQSRFTVFGLNPNDVAAFVILLILSLPVLLRCWKRAIWLVWPVEMVLLAVLVGTGSRGAVLALVVGAMVALILGSRVVLPKKIWILIGLALVLGIGGGLMFFPKGFRIGTLDVSPEASAGRRLEVWSTVPAMLAAAPSGWGIGHAAEAYEQWFEPVDDPVALKHLLSSHLTWLVEMGCPLRWLYCFSWIVGVGLTIPNQKFQFPVWGAAVWSAFFVALFYNAAGKWWNWPLPLFWLASALLMRCRGKTFPGLVFWTLSIVASGILVQAPLFYSERSDMDSIHAWDGGNVVSIGKGGAVVALLSPNQDVLGTFYGQQIRKQWHLAHRDAGSIIVIEHPDAAAIKYLLECRTYVFSGADKTMFNQWEQLIRPKLQANLILINCRTPADRWIQGFKRIDYYHGEFYGDPYYQQWQAFVTTRSGVSVKDVLGDETYIADWLLLLGDVKAR